MTAFSFLVGFAASLGLWRISQNRLIRNPWFWLTAGLVTLFGALLGARLGFVAVRGAYFWQHPSEILLFSAGGLSGLGAVLGGLISIAILSRTRRVPMGALSDGLFPMLPILAVFAWLGCWMSGAAYGLPAAQVLRHSFLVFDQAGSSLGQMPVQALAALALAVVFFLLESVYRPARSGQRSALGLACLGAVNFGVSLLRADPALTWNGLRLDGWAGLVLVALGLIWLFMIFLRHNRGLVQPNHFYG